MNQRKVGKWLAGGALAVAATLAGVLMAAAPAKALSGNEFTVMNHLTITLDPSDMNKSQISGPSVGTTPVTFAEANKMFQDATGSQGSFVTYSNGVWTADFENASVKSPENGDLIFGLGHMLIGDPWNTLFPQGVTNAITVNGSGKIVFKNLDVSIAPDGRGSGSTGTDHGPDGNIANGLLKSTNAILSVGSGCEVTLGDGVDISTATPSDSNGKTVACQAIFAENGGTIYIGSPKASASALAVSTEGTGAVIDGAASTTGTGRIIVNTGIITDAKDNGVQAASGSSVITATVGGQTVMGSSPMNLASKKINIPAGTVTVTSAPANATIFVGNRNTEVKNNSTNTINVGNAANAAAPTPLAPGASETVTPATAKQNLQLMVTNALNDYPLTDSDLYTPDSWKAYQTALTAAQDLINSTSAVTDTQYNTAATNLQNAINGLILVNVSYNELQSAINDAQALVGTDSSLYDATAWSAYQTALANAKTVLADPSSTSADMNGARIQLQKAVDALVIRVYRLYNPYTYTHLYSVNWDEVTTLDEGGWDYEGVAWNAPGSKTTTSVWRLYNKWSDDHLYTTSDDEIKELTDAGWTVDGKIPLCYGATQTTHPVYRLYNPYATANAGRGSHLWTANLQEYNDRHEDGWIQEGPVFNALSLPQ